MILKEKQVPIQEKFFSVQGEVGSSPSIFVRSGLCNLNCPGFGCKVTLPDGTTLVGCDTIRAVSPKFKNEWTYYSDYQTLVKDIKKLIPLRGDNFLLETKPDIVWTGGEPLLWWNTKVMQNTLSYFISRGHKVTIETNASQDIEFFREYQKKIKFSMSVKLSASGEKKQDRINIETITKIVENCPDSYLKFVINPETWENDIREIREILEEIPYFMNIYLMPLGQNKDELLKNTQFVMEKCVENGFSFSNRNHILAWNDKPGV